MEQNQSPKNQIIITHKTESNGMGIAGFVLTVLAIILSWVPVLGQILWFLGIIFSFAGIFKKPRGLAIAGLVISLVGLLIFIVFTVGFVGAFFVK